MPSPRTVLRQLRDIQHLAEKAKTHIPTQSEIEDFARYSQDLRAYLRTLKLDDTAIDVLNDIPEVEMEASVPAISLLAWLPGGLTAWYYERAAREAARREMIVAGGKYASLEFLLRYQLEE